MNRHYRPTGNQPPHHRDLQAWDPFAEMMEMRNRMLSNFGRGFFDDADDFGGFGRSAFGSGFSRNFDRGFPNFDQMLEEARGQNGRGGNYTMQSYSTTVVTGPDGRPVVETTINNEQATIGRDGKRIVERQEVYKHSGENVKRVTKERALDDKKVKVTREIKNDERNEYRELDNVHEEEVDHFNEHWNQKARENNFGRLGNGFGERERESDANRNRVRMIRYQ
jgi:hypothetical protein